MNCWHLNEHESTAMWDQYLRSESGIAIQSSYRRLVDSFSRDGGNLHIFIGKVSYIDYENDNINSENPLAAATYKRASFSHEAEVRAVAIGRDSSSQGFKWDMREFPEHGIDVQIEVENLISAIYVAPGSPEWFISAVTSVIAKYGLDVPVHPSSLDDKPLW